MKNILFSPDSSESSGASMGAPAKRAAKKSAAKTGGKKESAREAALHELCRRMGFDARADEHASKLVSVVAGASAAVVLCVGGMWLARVAMAVVFVSGVAVWAVTGEWPWVCPGMALATALDVVSFTVTAPGATATAMAAVAGDSAQVRNSTAGGLVSLVAMWSKAQAVGRTQITTPSMHDVTRGFQYRNIANLPSNMVPRGVVQRLKPQDVMSVQQIGSATAGDVELAHVMLLYDDLPGVQAQFIDSSQLAQRGVNLLAVEDTTTATVASTYSGSRLLNQNTNLLKANTWYALLGAKLGAVCGALCVQGSDVGNLRVAIPGISTPDIDTVNWFVQLSEWLGRPMIPIFNSANAGNIAITNVQDENLTAVPFSLVMVELSGG